MNRNTVHYQEMFRRYRKPLLISIAVLAVTLTLGIVGAVYAVYKAASYANEKLQTWEPSVTESATKVPAQALGVVEQIVLNVASQWLQQGAASGEVARVMTGLSCFDALGGPSPTAIVGYVEGKVADTALKAQLQEISKNLESNETGPTGPAACASWLLNG
jgi:hypothetical protein